MSGLIYLVHPETGGSTRVPDSPDVLAAHEARGWERADEPEPEPMRLSAPTTDGDIPAWVELQHPDLPGARQSVANDPGALAAAADAGWSPVVDEAAESDEPEAERPARKTKTPAAPAAAEHDDAGDGTNQKEH